MSLRDFRCQVSGVSLLGSEVALLFTQRPEELSSPTPATVPLWGRYEGEGNVVDIQEGPNADLVLASFQQALGSGAVQIDWERIGLEEFEVDHIETLASLTICAQLASPDAIIWEGAPLSLCLIQAHVAACLMEGEPMEISAATQIEELPRRVVGGAPAAMAIYAPIANSSVRLRCKFGLSFVALQALKEQASARGVVFDPPGEGVVESERQPERWLAEAFLAVEGHAGLAYALSEYKEEKEESVA